MEYIHGTLLNSTEFKKKTLHLLSAVSEVTSAAFWLLFSIHNANLKKCKNVFRFF